MTRRIWVKNGTSMTQFLSYFDWEKNLSTRSAGTHGNDCAGLVGRRPELLAHRFWLPQLPDLNPLDFSLWTHIEEMLAKHATVTQMSLRFL